MLCFFLFTFTNLENRNKKICLLTQEEKYLLISKLVLETNYFEKILFHILRFYFLFFLSFAIAKKILTLFLTKALIFNIEINWLL